MDRIPEEAEPTESLPGFSDDDGASQTRPLQGSSQHGNPVPTGRARSGTDRSEFSDDDIKIVYEIVVRAEAILTEDLTPSSRLPTHALFLAYDEILPQYGLDTGEHHLSKLVFMVGGVRGQDSLMGRFRHVMAQMNIELDIEDDEGAADEREGSLDSRAKSANAKSANAHEQQHAIAGAFDIANIVDHDGYRLQTRPSNNESDSHKSSPDSILDAATESLSIGKERHLASLATAFQRSRRARLPAGYALRRWHNVSSYVDALRAQARSIRDEVLMKGLCDKFRTWRALSAAVTAAPPDKVPSNAFSRRTEWIAIRTREIFMMKRTLAKWRHETKVEARRRRDAKSLSDWQNVQEMDDEGFKEDPYLSRLAQRIHENLAMSRAFATWSNRAMEEVAKAEMAAEVYEQSLKAKVLGLTRKSSPLGTMRSLVPSKTPRSDPIPSSTDSDAPKQQISTVVAEVKEQNIPQPIPPKFSLAYRPASIVAPGSLAKTKASPRPSVAIRPAATVSIVSKPSTDVNTSVGPNDTAASLIEPLPGDKPVEEPEFSDDDELDERTAIARRHILRMRYFGSWERHTCENIARVEQFQEDRRHHRLRNSLLTWRDRAASARQQSSENKMILEDTKAYERATRAVSRWRERTYRVSHLEETLRDYAQRADYYQRTMKAIPVMRGKAEQALQKENLLAHYAERSNYYSRGTQALSLWRERTREVSQSHNLQQTYSERADYYYRTRNTLLQWEDRAKRKRKDRLREAYLETRRIVKRGMGERWLREWRNQLEPSHERYDRMNAALDEAIEDREWRQTSQAFNTWRLRAQEREDVILFSEGVLLQKALGRWQEEAASQRATQAEATEHWDARLKSRALKNWNLSSIQGANRPEMVVNALEKRERRLLRQGFEKWYGRTAEKLVPVQLPDGSYMNVEQVLEGARRQATEDRARASLRMWRAKANHGGTHEVHDEYAPTPGRPRLLLGSLGRRETTTPMAPTPSRPRWGPRDSTMGRSDFTGRTSRSGRPKNMRVSWAP
ncbi:hypothetical protein F5Y17DRAFT_416299 [Xylariaceae sp. FL0594]|nr:hypothetical protein F5Y17DRAFT_416299 [Xylariaceae sp. FL0594]